VNGAEHVESRGRCAPFDVRRNSFERIDPNVTIVVVG
jgi:hypothetical protein